MRTAEKAETLYVGHRTRRAAAAAAAATATASGTTSIASNNVESAPAVAASEGATNPGDRILLRIARIATGASVRWKRNLKNSTVKEGDAADEEKWSEEKAAYDSRFLACTRCGAIQETKGMQLKVREGFKAIRCKSCGKQERVLRNRCSCNAVWHQCPTHRIDPPFHKSRKTEERENAGAEEADKRARLLSSTRNGPDVHDTGPQEVKAQIRKRGCQQSEGRLKAAKSNPGSQMPMSEMVKSVREKEAKRKAKQDEVAHRPTKAVCEGPAAASRNEDQTGTFRNPKASSEPSRGGRR